MDRNQADAIAEAILTPDAAHRQALADRRAARERGRVEGRFAAACTLAGAAIGAGIAHAAGARFTEGVIWGGLAASALAWGINLRRRQRAGRARPQ